MLGESLEQIGFTEEVHVPYVSVKEAVFPFVKFPGVDITLSPEMKSTGEVMSLDRDRGLAYLKSQLAAGNKVPSEGNIFVSLKDEDKQKATTKASRPAPCSASPVAARTYWTSSTTRKCSGL